MLRKSFTRAKTVIAVSMALALLLVACSNGNDETTSAPETANTEPDEALEPVIIRWAADHPGAPHPNGQAAEWFKEALEERIPGSEVRLYFAGALYSSTPEMLEAAAIGNLELLMGQYGKDSAFEPTAGIVNQPAALTSVGAIANVYDTEHMALLRERMAALGITTIANSSLSFYIGFAGKGPHPATPNDLRGLNVRTFDTVTQPTVLGAWGANAIAMPFSEVASALETGVIDGVLTTSTALRVLPAAPFYTAFGVGALGQDLYAYHASSLWLESLNEATRTVVVDTLREAAQLSLQFNWCNDQGVVEEFLTDDPNEPGFYLHPPESAQLFIGNDVLGEVVRVAVENSVAEEARPLVASWFAEAQALSAAHPPGSSEIEQTDCGPVNELRDRLTEQAG